MVLLLILLFLGLGLLAQRLPLRAAWLANGLNAYVLWLALPALALQHLSQLALHWGLLLPAAVAWLVFGLAWPWVWLGQRLFGWSRATTGCLLLTVGLGNTSFVGFPLLRWLYGEQALELAIFVDQPGSFLVLSTLGLVAGSLYVGQQADGGQMVKRVLTFPPFLAFGLALGLNLAQVPLPDWLLSVCAGVGASLTPAALLAVGLQLQLQQLGALRQPLLWGLGFRLGLSPLLILGLYGGLLGLRGELLGVSVLEAGMAPMITAGIVAAGLGLNPVLASLIVSVGIGVSLLSVPLWFLLLRGLGLG